MDKVRGSMETLSAMQLTAEMEGLDAQSKTLLHSKEVLAVILQGIVSGILEKRTTKDLTCCTF